MRESETSLWLGSARRPMRLAMIALTGLTVLLALGLFISRLFLGSEIGLKEFLHPGGYPIVLATLICGTLAVTAAGLYFSDTQGSIEPAPTGFFDYVSLWCSRVAMIAVAALVLVMFYEVVSRYVFVKPTLWANELSLWIAGFVFLLAGLYAMQQRSHIRIYVVYDLLPRWVQKVSDVLSVFLIWFFTFALIWGGYNEARDKWLRWETFGTAWDPPIPATMKAGILFIIALVAIQALSNLIADWHKPPESHTSMDEIDQTEIENLRRAVED